MIVLWGSKAGRACSAGQWWVGRGQQGLSLGRVGSWPGEELGTAPQVEAAKPALAMDVGKGAMAWELQVVLGPEPVAQEHMWEEPDPMSHNSILQGANDSLG